MTGIRRALLCLSALAFAAPAVAQDATTSFAQLRNVLHPGDVISITDEAGHQISGRLASISADSLDLVLERSRPGVTTPTHAGTAVASFERVHFLEPQVRLARRQRRDSIWNGALIGAALAAGPGFGVLLFTSGGSDDVGAVAAWTVPPLAVAGFAAGALIDGAHSSWLTLYHSPAPNGPQAKLAPILSRSGTGAQLLLRF